MIGSAANGGYALHSERGRARGASHGVAYLRHAACRHDAGTGEQRQRPESAGLSGAFSPGTVYRSQRSCRITRPAHRRSGHIVRYIDGYICAVVRFALQRRAAHCASHVRVNVRSLELAIRPPSHPSWPFARSRALRLSQAAARIAEIALSPLRRSRALRTRCG